MVINPPSVSPVRERELLPWVAGAAGWIVWRSLFPPVVYVDEAYAGLIATFSWAVLIALIAIPIRRNAGMRYRRVALVLRVAIAALVGASALAALIAAVPTARHHGLPQPSLVSFATRNFGVVAGLLAGTLLIEAVDVWPRSTASDDWLPDGSSSPT